MLKHQHHHPAASHLLCCCSLKSPLTWCATLRPAPQSLPSQVAHTHSPQPPQKYYNHNSHTPTLLLVLLLPQLNLVRNAAPSATVAPFPGGSHTQPSANPHALPPSNMDPEWARAAAEEGLVAYKNLLGPNQNMSHIPGADVEAQEITTVADMLNFETKKQMYKRFSTGFGVFMIAQLCE